MNFSIKRAICIVAVLGAAASGAFGQAKAEPGAADAKAEETILSGAAYDVATIRPTKPSDMGGVRTLPSGEFQSTGMSLKTTVGTAYGKFDFQILGGPAWFESDKYDVDAKPDSALEAQLQQLSWEQREKVQGRMLQTLLEDRVKLKVHDETKELPVFALVVANSGVKLHEAKTGEPYRMTVGNGRIVAQGMPMDDLAAQLTETIDHIVRNKTGLAGAYDFTLRYSEDDAPVSDSAAPSIYTALQEQLGLKLESTKGPVEVLVIDHVERPSEN